MVHFDFIVDDGEAETIFDCVHQRINEMHELIFKDSIAMGITTSETEKKKYAAQIEWYRSHIKFITQLKYKMEHEERG